MKLGEVCLHGSLRRCCEICDLNEMVQAADALAKAASSAKKYLEPDLVEPGRTVFWGLAAALAAYEKVRGK